MFEGKTEQEARKEILEIIKEYYNTYHHTNTTFQEGQKIAYAGRVYDEQEMINLVDSALDFWLTSGKYTKKFEEALANFLGIKYCSFVNSGSSANLLAFMCLTSPLLKERAIQKGDEVITVAAGFPTTIAPIIQFGAVPVFVDITIPEYNIDVQMLEKALSKKTKAIMIAHTLGNPFDLQTVKTFCEKHHLWLIEDNCDALGSQYILNGEKRYTGTIGDIGTSSFYPPHHITTGEGGAVYTDNPLLHKIIRSLRDWGRECSCPSGVDNLCGHRFDGKFGELPQGYDHKYVYSHFGYNLKATDLQAAIGCAQIKKIETFTKLRRRNFQMLKEGLKDYTDRFILPEETENAITSWFGFLITCREGICRNELVKKLEENGIQTRNLFAGNIIKHPCFDNMRKTGKGYRIVGNLKNTETVMNQSFWLGVYPKMTEEMIIYMLDVIKQL